MLNNSQVKEIFEREAILIGTSDGVPYYKAVELFGKEAATYKNITEIRASGVKGAFEE